MQTCKRIVLFQYFVIFTFFVIILLLILQNIGLKRKIQALVSQETVPQGESLRKSFILKRFPIEVKIDDFRFITGFNRDNIHGHVFIIFDMTVCGQCLNSAIDTLRTFDEVLFQKGIRILSFIGISHPNEESEIIDSHRSGKIFFPYQPIPVDILYKSFLIDRNTFLDTPLFVYTDHEYKIIDIFKPKYLETEELLKWLTTIAEQDF